MKYYNVPNKNTALYELAPGCVFSIRDPAGVAEIVGWEDNGTGISQPTEEAIQTEIDRQTLEWDAQEYARNRKEEYPTIEELTIALYDTDDKAAIETKRAAVKTKWPKNNLGPV